jgi:hypothetical protein
MGDTPEQQNMCLQHNIQVTHTADERSNPQIQLGKPVYHKVLKRFCDLAGLLLGAAPLFYCAPIRGTCVWGVIGELFHRRSAGRRSFRTVRDYEYTGHPY